MTLSQPVMLLALLALATPCHAFQTGAAGVLQVGSTTKKNACSTAMVMSARSPPDAIPMSQTWDPNSYQKNAAFVADLGTPVLDLLKPKKHETILDLGCGDGALTQKLAERGCRVVGIDASAKQVAGARKRGLEAHVMDGTNIRLGQEFDAVFSNAALHWMSDPDAVISGVKRVLKPQGRFVAECGGHGNVLNIRNAMERALGARGIDASKLNPWYFPSVEEYSAKLRAAGFVIDSIELFPRPTQLPGDVVGWLQTFGESYMKAVPEDEHEAVLAEVREELRPLSEDENGVWFSDYVRLRFAAHLD